MPATFPAQQSPSDHAPRWRPLLIALALLGYGYWFYTRPLTSLAPHEGRPWRRWELFQFLLVPDALYEQWLGGAVAPALADRGPLLGVALALAFAGALAGRALLGLLGVRRHLDRAETWWFSAVLGAALESYLTWCVGLIGKLHEPAWLIVPLSMLAAVGGVLAFRPRLSAPHAASSSPPFASAVCLFALPFVALLLLGSLLPPVEFDVREYHLQAPKEFFQSGRVQYLPHNVYGNMPLLAEMWPLAGMVVCGDWWRGALVGKLLMGSMSLVTAWGLLLAGRRCHSPTAGLAAALVYLSIPWVVRLSASGFNEPAVACFALAACFAAYLARDPADAAPNRSTSIAGLAGLLAGCAVACKYPSAVLVAMPLAAWLFWQADQQRMRTTAAYLTGLTITAGPWLVKNAITIGNPWYPLLGSMFGCGTWSAEQIARWNAAHRAGPWTFEAGLHAARDLVGGTEWLSPLLWPLAIAALLAGWHRPAVRYATLYVGWVLACWWLLTHRVDRFWFPAIPVLCLLAGIGADDVTRTPWGRRTLALLGAMAVAANLLFASLASPGYYNRFLMPLSAARQDPLRVPAWQRWLNNAFRTGQLQGRAVLAVGEAEVFDIEPPVTYATAFDDCVLELRVRGRSAEQVREALAPFAFVLVRWDELARYRSPGNYGYSDFVTHDVLARLVQDGLLEPAVYRDPPREASGTTLLPRVEIYPVPPGATTDR